MHLSPAIWLGMLPVEARDDPKTSTNTACVVVVAMEVGAKALCQRCLTCPVLFCDCMPGYRLSWVCNKVHLWPGG